MLEEEKLASNLVRSSGHLLPSTIPTLRCMSEAKRPGEVNSKSVICKTKKKNTKIIEVDDNGVVVQQHIVNIPVDCVAFKTF